VDDAQLRMSELFVHCMPVMSGKNKYLEKILQVLGFLVFKGFKKFLA